MRKLQIHRYVNKIAIGIAGGETIYISAGDASAIARALGRVASDVKRIPEFGNSEFGTYTIPVKDRFEHD